MSSLVWDEYMVVVESSHDVGADSMPSEGTGEQCGQSNSLQTRMDHAGDPTPYSVVTKSPTVSLFFGKNTRHTFGFTDTRPHKGGLHYRSTIVGFSKKCKNIGPGI